MHLRRTVRVLGWFLVVAGCAGLLAGCGGGSGRPPTQEEKNLKALTVCYGEYIRRNQGQSPPGPAEFKQFIKTRDKNFLESLGVDTSDMDKLFTSSRDGEPFVVIYKLKSTAPDAEGKVPVVIYEKTGSGGQRWVGDALARVELLDEAAFKKRVGGS